MAPKRSLTIDKSLLYNKYVLYLVFIAAVGNLLTLFTVGDMRSAIVFVLVGFLTSFFSKNMVVILCVAMAVSNVLKYGAASLEGYTGNDDEEEEKEDEEHKKTKKEKSDSKESMSESKESMSEKEDTEDSEKSEKSEDNIADIVAKYSEKAESKKTENK